MPFSKILQNRAVVMSLTLAVTAAHLACAGESHFESELIFPLDAHHNHAPGIVETPSGDLLVSWYRGSGERQADDVAVFAAWKRKDSQQWSKPFVLADTPGFPDCNTALFIDNRDQLWLFYPTVLANSWESCLTNYKVSARYPVDQDPTWDRQSFILLKPNNFAEAANATLDTTLGPVWDHLTEKQRQNVKSVRDRLDDKLYQRLGWQPRCKPTQLPAGRLILPLYSDTYSISIMALSDDYGRTWHASAPLLGWGHIQPTVLRRNDGTLVAFMRENGITGRIRTAESNDEGETWSSVHSSELPNPGSGLDGLRLSSGNWLLVYNDTIDGRNRLAVSLSEDEGRTWGNTKHLEDRPTGSFHYPAVTQGRDGRVHVVYSFFVQEGKSMKHVAFEEGFLTEAMAIQP